MDFFTNVPTPPKAPYVLLNGDFYHPKDKVRILLSNKDEYIVEVKRITHEAFVVDKGYYELTIFFNTIDKIRMAKRNEDLNSEPFFDEEEMNYWMNHYYTKNGIERRLKCE